MIDPIYRQVEEDKNKESAESNTADGEEDFIPSGALSHSPNVPVLSFSPSLGMSVWYIVFLFSVRE